MTKAGKYMSDIHLEDYTEQYESLKASADTMVFTGGRKSISLNGSWHYAVDQYDTCLRQKWFNERYIDDKGFTLPVDYSFDSWPLMELPSCWNTLEREYLIYDGSMVFTRCFKYDPGQGEKAILRIGAANYICRVFLNGQYIGMHRGGSTPAFFDISEYVREDNRIIIAVDSTRRPEQVPTENTDWFNYGGIYRDIEIIPLPGLYIKDFRVSLLPDDSYHRIRAQLQLSEALDTTAILKLKELGINMSIDVRGGHGELIIEAEPELWSPDSPKLYDVSLSCQGDMVTDKVGFRQISVRGRDILLNGQKVFLRGISCHEESVKGGKALTHEERIENIKLAKELGCNFMRIAHYPHHEDMAMLADEMGMLLWEEIPVYWAIRFDRKATYEDAENQLRELMIRDYNRASVIVWSVGNENADSDERLKFMSSLAECAHKADDTRLVSAACLVDSEKVVIADRLADYLDVIGINEYCGWYTPDFEMLPLLMKNSDPSKPVIITEFGADALSGLHGSIEDKGTEQCQEYVYKKQIEVLKNIDYIGGMTPWILYDFRCPRRTSDIQKYYNRKGLLSEDKSYRKPAFYVLQSFYREMTD
ncbi:glycoside hydrolase family 2 protein [Butyrivibrio sp. MC2013]|uniref:glycoside hydrolase family 2 protein n=1 Tax=Butyrivibrio sp. MC2013 TaxID=1280686 RepID=UPI0003F791D2|nr:glycoside hydrolase family 2 [Butyrivibrio sp. MC2013]